MRNSVTVYHKGLDISTEAPRLLGKLGDPDDGNTLLILAGIHGNEPAGIFAYKRVMRILQKAHVHLKGCVVGVTGNMAALEAGVRFIDKDMNRICSTQHLEAVERGEELETTEDKELREIMKEIRVVEASEHPQERYFMDVHTVSSQSPPFISVDRKGRNKALAAKMPVYDVRGLVQGLVGTLDEYLATHTWKGFTFEAGQHDDLGSVENAEAAIILMLEIAGIITIDDLDCYLKCKNHLETYVVEGNKSFKLDYIYSIEEGEEFEMKPGFVGFSRIKKGEVLAHNKHGNIIAKSDGRILMPLYQKQGEDGFFMIKKIKDEVAKPAKV